MPDDSPLMQRILVPIDFSPWSARAARYAAALYAQAGVEIHLLHVVTATPLSRAYLTGSAEERAGDVLAEVRSEVQQEIEARVQTLGRVVAGARPSGARVTTAIRWSQAGYHAIVEYAREHAIETIVVGSHGRTGLSYVLLGSTANMVVRHAPCPVLVLRRGQREFVSEDPMAVSLRRIIVPTDLSLVSVEAASHAARLARRFGAEVVIACAPGETAVDSELDGLPGPAGERLRSALGEAEVVVLAAGPPARRLVELARTREADMIVMTARGRNTAGDHLLGSVSERVLRQAPCAVYLVR